MTEQCSHPSTEVIMHTCEEHIRKYGWHCVGVFGEEDSPPFCYTIGLLKTHQHPELVIVGLNPELGHGVLISAVALIEQGENLAGSEQWEMILEEFPVQIRPVNLRTCTLSFGVSDRYYDREVPRLQVVWPDPKGLFPNDPAMDTAMAIMQIIG